MVTPYLTQHRPPALVAMLPPMLQISYDDGSGGYHSPCSATAFLTSALNSPGCTTAVRVTGSTVISRIRSVDSTMPLSNAVAPPDNPLPVPRGTTGTRCWRCPAQHGLDIFGAQRAHDGHRLSRGRVQRAVLAVGLGDRGVGDHHAFRQLGDQLGQGVRGHVAILRSWLLRDPPCAVQHRGYRWRRRVGPRLLGSGRKAGRWGGVRSIGRCASRISPWPQVMSLSWIAPRICRPYDIPATLLRRQE